MKSQKQKRGKRNPVAKFMNLVNRSEVHRDKKKYNRAKENRLARIETSAD